MLTRSRISQLIAAADAIDSSDPIPPSNISEQKNENNNDNIIIDNVLPPPINENRPPKRKYGKYENEIRASIIEKYLIEGKGPKEIYLGQNSNNKIPYCTIKSIIRTFKKNSRINKKHKGGAHTHYSNDELKQICDWQSENNSLRYKDLRKKFAEFYEGEKKEEEKRFPSDKIIKKAFDQYGITTKQMEREPPQRNAPANIEKRREYCLRAIDWDMDKIIFIDEKGFNLHSFRRRGRNYKGRRAIVIAPSSQGALLSVCAAVSPVYGLLHYRIQTGTYNGDNYIEFLTELFQKPLLRTKSFHLIMDNGPAHRPNFVSEYIQEFQAIQHFCEKLPPYSPHINVIEYTFARWAKLVNMELKPNEETLLTVMNRIFNTTTPQEIENYYHLVTRYYSHCINREPLKDNPVSM